jgi:enamine deaminase RidA (YjgF/YER057c/UK114 family)
MMSRHDRSIVRSFLLSITLCASLVVSVTRAEGQVAIPLAGAPYSAGVTMPSGATLAVIGGIEGTGANTAAAASAALKTMATRLAEVGLDKGSVVRVRAALAPAEAADFTGWNTAWTAFFDGGLLPARVTVGASALPGTARIVLDVVAAFPAARGYPATVNGARPTPNPNIRLAGPATNPTSIVSTGAGMYFSSGVLPARDSLADPESMEQHIRGAMNSLTNSLGTHGLQWSDAFFVRVLPTPQPARTTVDFAGWSPVLASLNGKTRGLAPAWSMWAAPGFGATGRYVEIEVWAVPQAPHALFQTLDATAQNRLLRMSGAPTGMISSGALVAPNAELIFLSGVVAPEGTAPEEEGAVALRLMSERLAGVGASMADVAELRVYRVQGENGFNAAYSAHFNNAQTNPHRPVRTNYLVERLPGGRLVEVEAIVVRPSSGF